MKGPDRVAPRLKGLRESIAAPAASQSGGQSIRYFE